MVPLGVQTAIATRVSNELGTLSPYAARYAAMVGLVLGTCATSVFSVAILLGRKQWSQLFSTNEGVQRLVEQVSVISAIYFIGDSGECCLNGVVKGSGRQWQASIVTIIAYYAIAVPLSALLAFRFHMGVMGLAIGTTVGTYAHFIGLGLLVGPLDWEHEAEKACRKANVTRPLLDDDHDHTAGGDDTSAPVESRSL